MPEADPEAGGGVRRISDAGVDRGGTELRRTPRVGDIVNIVHLAAWEAGTVLAVHDGGRRLEVRGEEQGVTHEFVLNRATARFVAGGSHGPRLRWPGARERVAEPDERG